MRQIIFDFIWPRARGYGQGVERPQMLDKAASEPCASYCYTHQAESLFIIRIQYRANIIKTADLAACSAYIIELPILISSTETSGGLL
jgi:hypothetical protein